MPLSGALAVDGLTLRMSGGDVIKRLGEPSRTRKEGDNEFLRYGELLLRVRFGILVELQGGSSLTIRGEEVARRGDSRGEVLASLGPPDQQEDLDVRSELACVFYEGEHQVLMVAFNNYRACSFVLLPFLRPGEGGGGSGVPIHPLQPRRSPGKAQRRPADEL